MPLGTFEIRLAPVLLFVMARRSVTIIGAWIGGIVVGVAVIVAAVIQRSNTASGVRSTNIADRGGTVLDIDGPVTDSPITVGLTKEAHDDIADLKVSVNAGKRQLDGLTEHAHRERRLSILDAWSEHLQSLIDKLTADAEDSIRTLNTYIQALVTSEGVSKDTKQLMSGLRSSCDTVFHSHDVNTELLEESGLSVRDALAAVGYDEQRQRLDHAFAPTPGPTGRDAITAMQNLKTLLSVYVTAIRSAKTEGYRVRYNAIMGEGPPRPEHMTTSD